MDVVYFWSKIQTFLSEFLSEMSKNRSGGFVPLTPPPGTRFPGPLLGLRSRPLWPSATVCCRLQTPAPHRARTLDPHLGIGPSVKNNLCTPPPLPRTVFLGMNPL